MFSVFVFADVLLFVFFIVLVLFVVVSVLVIGPVPIIILIVVIVILVAVMTTASPSLLLPNHNYKCLKLIYHYCLVSSNEGKDGEGKAGCCLKVCVCVLAFLLLLSLGGLSGVTYRYMTTTPFTEDGVQSTLDDCRPCSKCMTCLTLISSK